MADHPENAPLATNAAIAFEAAKSAWKSARNRYAATHEAVLRGLDKPIHFAMDSLEPGGVGIGSPGIPIGSNFISPMSARVMLLADALQRRALMKIIETGTALDEIDNAVAAKMRSDAHVETGMSSNPKDT